MLVFKDVSLRRGGMLLIEGASFIIHEGQKVGIIGANGTGKSSLFSLLRGELQTDAGDVSIPHHWTMAYVAQEMHMINTPAIDYVIDGDYTLRKIQAEMLQAEDEDDGELIAGLHARLEAINGYHAQSRASKLMSGLGFTKEQESAAVDSFSGGWRMRLNLAQALMCRSDLLLLDEPTNHLDLDAVIWLEGWLREYTGTLLLISHDREFLDRVVGHIVCLEHNKMTLYRGNYSAYEKCRAEQLAQQQAGYEKQQREIAHIHKFVNRFRAKATKAKQAQSRLKSLQRMELISAAHIGSPFRFSFRKPDKLPHPLLTLEKVDAGYNDIAVLNDITIGLVPGDRIGLLGPNGAGKSTLIKLLAAELFPLKGKFKASDGIHIGYFAQHQIEQLSVADSILQHFKRLDPQAGEQQLRDFIGDFGFHGDRVKEPVAPFSGGEKARLVLALLVYQKPNLLLLDEPTNHLDLEMRHALSVALQEFEGAMVIVSHDRNLLTTVTDKFFLVADGCVKEFNGDMEDYCRWLMYRRAKEKKNIESTTTGNNELRPITRKEQRQIEADQRVKLQPFKKEQSNLENRMEQLNLKKLAIDKQLIDNDLYKDSEKERLKQLLFKQSELVKELREVEEKWLLVCEQLEALQSDQF